MFLSEWKLRRQISPPRNKHGHNFRNRPCHQPRLALTRAACPHEDSLGKTFPHTEARSIPENPFKEEKITVPAQGPNPGYTYSRYTVVGGYGRNYTSSRFIAKVETNEAMGTE